MTEETVAEIEAIRAAFEAAENRGDPSVQLDRRAETDYVRMPPGRPPMGPAEAADELERLYAEGGFSVAWDSDGVLAGETLAVDGGSFTVTWETNHGDANTRRGSWLMVFRRNEDEDWEVVRDIYNWDEPAP